MNTLRDKWESYAAEVMPKNTPAIQVQECRRAFYAGAFAHQILAILASTKSESAACKMLDGWYDEIKAFYHSVGTANEGK